MGFGRETGGGRVEGEEGNEEGVCGGYEGGSRGLCGFGEGVLEADGGVEGGVGGKDEGGGLHRVTLILVYHVTVV